jgi:hypothetical protein
MALADDTFPNVDPALVERLDVLFPERTPDLGTPVDNIRFDAGARSVVRLLKRKLEEREESAMAHDLLSPKAS